LKQKQQNNSLYVPSVGQKYDKIGNNPTFIDSKTRIQDKELSDRSSMLHSLQVENGLSPAFIASQKPVFESSVEL